MSDIALELIKDQLPQVHQMMLKATEDLSEEQLTSHRAPTVPAIGFHLWHIARMSDRLQASLSPDRQEIWEAEGLAAACGLDAQHLGRAQVGAGLDEDVSVSLSLPSKETLLGYARRAFSAADIAVGSLTGEELSESKPTFSSNERDAITGIEILKHILKHLGHASRHLGCIEALRGTDGMRGTATS